MTKIPTERKEEKIQALKELSAALKMASEVGLELPHQNTLRAYAEDLLFNMVHEKELFPWVCNKCEPTHSCVVYIQVYDLIPDPTCEEGLDKVPEWKRQFEVAEVSLCDSCHCMTHTVHGRCGKCEAPKRE